MSSDQFLDIQDQWTLVDSCEGLTKHISIEKRQNNVSTCKFTYIFHIEDYMLFPEANLWRKYIYNAASLTS